MNISENEMISAEQSIALLTGLGIKVPDDIDVIEDDTLDGYIHYICKITLIMIGNVICLLSLAALFFTLFSQIRF